MYTLKVRLMCALKAHSNHPFNNEKKEKKKGFFLQFKDEKQTLILINF